MNEETTNLRVGIAALATALTLIAYYAIDRSQAAMFSTGPSPATVIATGRAEYFWRVIICGYMSPFVFTAWYFIARGREDRAWTIASRAVVPVCLIAATLSVLFP